jgi:hypothetical protein
MVALVSTFHPFLGVFFYLFGLGLGSADGHVLPDTSPGSWSSSVSLHAFALLALWPS